MKPDTAMSPEAATVAEVEDSRAVEIFSSRLHQAQASRLGAGMLAQPFAVVYPLSETIALRLIWRN